MNHVLWSPGHHHLEEIHRRSGVILVVNPVEARRLQLTALRESVQDPSRMSYKPLRSRHRNTELHDEVSLSLQLQKLALGLVAHGGIFQLRQLLGDQLQELSPTMCAVSSAKPLPLQQQQ